MSGPRTKNSPKNVKTIRNKVATKRPQPKVKNAKLRNVYR